MTSQILRNDQQMTDIDAAQHSTLCDGIECPVALLKDLLDSLDGSDETAVLRLA